MAMAEVEGGEGRDGGRGGMGLKCFAEQPLRYSIFLNLLSESV